MIISNIKDRNELLEHLQGNDKIFLIGCAACATACKSGGEEEVLQMQEWLNETGREVTGYQVIDETCHIMRAARDLRQHKDAVSEADAIMVMACGAGIQSISSSTDKRVIGALDSQFLGNIRRFGQYEEKCSLCGDCILNETAGICPVTNCAKGLLNGPCGGMEDGLCEINCVSDNEIECAWHLIHERLKAQGRSGVFARTVKPKSWSKRNKPGRYRLSKT